jgi:hypothetical protein
MVRIKRGVRLIIRRTEKRWETVGGGAFLDGGQEGSANASTSTSMEIVETTRAVK